MAARIEYVACPLCESADIAFLREANCTWHDMYKPQLPPTIRWMRCAACGHVFTDGYYTDEALAILFSGTHDYQTPGRDLVNGRWHSSHMIQAVEEARSFRQGRWLDVGFGNGSLLTTAAEFGWDVVGLDLREQSVESMRASGFECHALDIVDYHPSEAFDVITFADVLEHIPFPKPALRHAHEILAADGLLFLSMPNMDSYIWREASERNANPYWSELEHYHNFGRQRLYELLEEVGFRPIRYTMSERYIMCMQVMAVKAGSQLLRPSQDHWSTAASPQGKVVPP